jgi:hypothetical protein
MPASVAIPSSPRGEHSSRTRNAPTDFHSPGMKKSIAGGSAGIHLGKISRQDFLAQFTPQIEAAVRA